MSEHSIATLANLGIEAAEPVPMCATPEPGAELFVINLCASMTPMPEVPKSLKGFESYKLYQVSKMEDGRRRYRLRLGFFTSEADAELVVSSVRNIYPAAFSGGLSAEDLRYTGGFQARPLPPAEKPAAVMPLTPAPKPTVVATPTQPQAAAPAKPMAVVAPKIAPTTATPIAAPIPVKPAASAPAPATAKPTPPTRPAAPVELTLELDLRPEKKPASPAAAPASAAVMPFHVAKGVTVPDVSLELALEAPAAKAVPAKPAAPTVAQAQASMAAAMATNKMPATVAPSVARDVIPPPPRIIEDYIPILDTTLTLRTLTQAEIEDPNQPAWYVVELALSDHPVNLEAMPKLDIFAAYSLYSVAITTAGTIRHALRLGFFRESVSAEAVAGYLKTFFPTPSVTRISAAEHTRFADQPRKPAAPAAEKSTDKDKVVQLNDKRTASLLQTPANAPKAVAPVSKPTIAKPAVPVKKPGAVKGMTKNSQSLSAQLREEARQVMLSESGIRKSPAKPQSFLSRLIGRSLD